MRARALANAPDASSGGNARSARSRAQSRAKRARRRGERRSWQREGQGLLYLEGGLKPLRNVLSRRLEVSLSRSPPRGANPVARPCRGSARALTVSLMQRQLVLMPDDILARVPLLRKGKGFVCVLLLLRSLARCETPRQRASEQEANVLARDSCVRSVLRVCLAFRTGGRGSGKRAGRAALLSRRGRDVEGGKRGLCLCRLVDSPRRHQWSARPIRPPHSCRVLACRASDSGVVVGPRAARLASPRAQKIEGRGRPCWGVAGPARPPVDASGQKKKEPTSRARPDRLSFLL